VPGVCLPSKGLYDADDFETFLGTQAMDQIRGTSQIVEVYGSGS